MQCRNSKTKVTGAEKLKFQCAVLQEVIGGKEDSGNVAVICLYLEDRIKEATGKGMYEPFKWSGNLGHRLEGNIRCNPSKGDDHESAEGMQAGVGC